ARAAGGRCRDPHRAVVGGGPCFWASEALLLGFGGCVSLRGGCGPPPRASCPKRLPRTSMCAAHTHPTATRVARLGVRGFVVARPPLLAKLALSRRDAGSVGAAIAATRRSRHAGSQL